MKFRQFADIFAIHLTHEYKKLPIGCFYDLFVKFKQTHRVVNITGILYND